MCVIDVKWSVMRLLAGLAMMQKPVLFHKMSSSEAVHADAVRFQCTNFLIMWEHLEAWTCIKWMSFCFASDTIRRGVGGVCCKRCDGFVRERLILVKGGIGSLLDNG